MHRAVQHITLLAGFAALHACANGRNAVSAEAKLLTNSLDRVLGEFEMSQALFGGKAAAISDLAEASQETTPHPVAFATAEQFLRSLPDGIRMPEIVVLPSGSVAFEWIKSRTSMFTLSIGKTGRLAFAWLDGTDQGHAVCSFDGRHVPEPVLQGLLVAAVKTEEDASLRPA